MANSAFDYKLFGDTIVFTDLIRKNYPFISKKPRNHESIFFVTKGNLVYSKDNEEAVVREGQVGYIARGSIDISAAYECEEVSYIATNFNFSKENEIPVQTLPFGTVCSKNHIHNYDKLFADIVNVCLLKSPAYITICSGILTQIIGMLYNEKNVTGGEFLKINRISKAVDHLQKNFCDNDFKIKKLSGLANMSEKNFRRIFFDIYKQTPYNYLQNSRIDHAKILLKITSRSISEISEQCGFSDVYSFSHSFKSHTGISPLQYKRQVT